MIELKNPDFKQYRHPEFLQTLHLKKWEQKLLNLFLIRERFQLTNDKMNEIKLLDQQKFYEIRVVSKININSKMKAQFDQFLINI